MIKDHEVVAYKEISEKIQKYLKKFCIFRRETWGIEYSYLLPNGDVRLNEQGVRIKKVLGVPIHNRSWVWKNIDPKNKENKSQVVGFYKDDKEKKSRN